MERYRGLPENINYFTALRGRYGIFAAGKIFRKSLAKGIPAVFESAEYVNHKLKKMVIGEE